MRLSLFNAILYGTLAVVQIPFWLKWRRLKFDNPFDALIRRRLRQTLFVTFALLGAGLVLVLVGANFPRGSLCFNIFFVAGASFIFGAFGAGSDASAVRRGLVSRADGHAEFSKRELLQMTSVKNALTTKAPVLMLLAVAGLTAVMWFSSHR